MKNVATIFGKAARRKAEALTLAPWPLPEQLIGIEVEVESTQTTQHPLAYKPYWRTERDGSLRNGTEYILASPLKGDTLSAAIGDLFHGSKFERTTTGSTHVHLDMMEETTTSMTIKLLVLLAYIFEPAVFQLADPGREWCGYTNKLTSAPDSLVGTVLNSNEDTDYSSLLHLCADGHRVGRYYGINVLALQEHGSIEFRYFPTASSPEELASWVRLIQCFKKAALETTDTEQLSRIVEDVDAYTQFVNNYFSEWSEVFLSKVPHYQAVASLNKAFAVAGSYHYNTTIEGFNYDVLENSKLYSKFMKKTGTKRKLPELFVRTRSGTIPDAENGTGNMLLLTSGLYISSGNQWLDCRHDSIHRYLSGAILRDCVRMLSTSNYLAQAATAGFSSAQLQQASERVQYFVETSVRAVAAPSVPPPTIQARVQSEYSTLTAERVRQAQVRLSEIARHNVAYVNPADSVGEYEGDDE
jgi:hypothetical protein